MLDKNGANGCVGSKSSAEHRFVRVLLADATRLQRRLHDEMRLKQPRDESYIPTIGRGQIDIRRWKCGVVERPWEVPSFPWTTTPVSALCPAFPSWNTTVWASTPISVMMKGHCEWTAKLRDPERHFGIIDGSRLGYRLVSVGATDVSAESSHPPKHLLPMCRQRHRL